MIKGWITKYKGNVVNWVEVVATTIQKKAQHVSSGFLPRALSEKLDCNDGSKLLSGLGMSLRLGVLPLEVDHALKFGDFDLSMRGLASLQEIRDVEKLLDFKHDMQEIRKSCLKQLKEKKQKLQERLVGLQLSMEDQMDEFVKVQNNM